MANKEWLASGIDGLTFGERLGDLISSKGITQKALTDMTHLKQSNISSYINGHSAPDCASLIALAKAFSVSTDYLLGRTKTKSIDEDVQTVCRVTGLKEDNIYDLMGLSEPNIAPYLRDMVNEFLHYAVEDRAVVAYMAFRKYMDMDKQRWDDLNNLSQEEYQRKAEERRRFEEEAKNHGYLIKSYNEAAESQWKILYEDYGKYLLNKYRPSEHDPSEE